MLRRLYKDQPVSFAFTPENQAWAEAQIKKYPEGRQASAIIPLLWRAQEQEGWLTRPAIEGVAAMLDLAYIRALEVATFYFMFQLQPVGSAAHIQICGTTSCMICGAEDLIAVCKEKIAPNPHQISEDGKLSWEEVECLGACTNAPMAQIGKDYYEDLTAETFGQIVEDLRAGKVPTVGSQIGRFSSEPKGGLTSLAQTPGAAMDSNGSVALANAIGDTVKRIDGTEVPLLTPWISHGAGTAGHGIGTSGQSEAKAAPQPSKPVEAAPTQTVAAGTKPAVLTEARGGKADDLKQIKGIGPKLEVLCNALGFYHFDQIANWTADEAAWVDQNLEGFKGRVTRDEWIAQAKVLAEGGETEFSKRAADGKVYK